MEITTTAATEIKTTSAVLGGEITGDTGEYKPIVDHLMISEARFAQVSRQIITAKIKYDGVLRPFMLFTDSKQSDKTFILVGYRMDVLNDSYDIELVEYDNSSVIDLVDVIN